MGEKIKKIRLHKIHKTNGSIAAVWIVVIVSFLVLMLTYTTMYGVIVDSLYQMVVYYTGSLGYGNIDAANKVRMFFTLFPRFFMPAVLIWAFMMSFRRESDEYRV